MEVKQALPKFQEEFSAKISALTILTTFGYTFMPPSQYKIMHDINACHQYNQQVKHYANI